MLGYDGLPLKLASCDCRDLQSAMGWYKAVFQLVKSHCVYLKDIRQVCRQNPAAFLLEAWSPNSAQSSWESYSSVNSVAAGGVCHLWVSVTFWSCGRQHCTVDVSARPL